jgi:hypothetical protein
VREELQCGGCGRIRTGAAGPRVKDVGGRRGEGSGRGQAVLRAARGGYGDGPGVGGLQFSRRQRGVSVTWHRTGSRLGSFLQARAHERQ